MDIISELWLSLEFRIFDMKKNKIIQIKKIIKTNNNQLQQLKLIITWKRCNGP